jgi:small subunit ribosomal protein S20
LTSCPKDVINILHDGARAVGIKQSSEEKTLANHKSALKRNKQNLVRNARNTHIRSTMRTFVKQVREAVATGDTEAAKVALSKVVPYIDKAAAKGIIHKATASRKIARLQKLVNTLQ